MKYIIAKQCLTADTKIQALDKSNGQLAAKPLSELAKLCSFNALSLNLQSMKTEIQKAIITDAGIKPVIELRTESGRSVKAAAGHRLYVLKDKKLIMKNIEDIKEGDELACLSSK